MIVRINNLAIDMTHGRSLSDINLELHAGECLVIKTEVLQVGTILLRSLIGLENGVSGEVFINGTDILSTESRMERLELRKDIGLVYRERGLISVFNMADNIALPLGYHHDVSKEKLYAAVEKIADRLKIRYLLSRHVQQVNETETRLVALARELIREPQLLLIDAILEGLSTELQELALEAIEEVRERTNTAVIMTTRRQHLPLETRAYELREGTLIPVAT